MTRKLNILQIISKANINSGGSMQAFQLARELTRRGHRVSFVCRPLNQDPQGLGDDKLQLVPLKMKSEFDLHSVIELYKLMKKEKTDVVHVHKGLAHSLAYLAAYFAKVPVFVVNRGVSFPLDRFNGFKYRLSRISKIIAVSEDVKQVLIDSGKIKPQKIEVIYGGTDLERFDLRISADGVRREFGIQPQNTVIGIIANIRVWKGHQLLLQAARQIVKIYPDTIFLIVGKAENSLSAQLKKQTNDLGLEQNVIFTGYRRDIPQLIAAMDFTVNCSTAGEGLTGVLRESLAMKKPAIATDIGGNRELIINGETGRLIPPAKIEALVEAIRFFLENPAERARMGDTGYKLVREKFTNAARIDKIEALYNALLAGPTQ
jgi:glycosyltransferase involved in cell wall biosynthesis